MSNIDKASPKVSVVMPVHNGEEYLCDAIQSILHQTLVDLELIVIDDGSTDGTSQILHEFGENDDRVRVFNSERQGIVRSLNTGLELARADFVARMDADDISLPERLAKQYAFLTENPEVVLVGSAHEIIGASGIATGLKVIGPTTRESFQQARDSCSVIFSHPTVMYRREVILSVGGYPQDYDAAEDFALWNRLADEHLMLTIPEPLLQYRIHDSSIGTAAMSVQINSSQLISANTARRRAGMSELSADEFAAQLRLKGPIFKFARAMNLRSRAYFRRGGARIADRQPIGFVWFILAAISSPRSFWNKLMENSS